MTITVHHLEKSRSQRVLWLLEELGVEYELKEYKRDRITMLAPSELKTIHPLGKSPIVVDGEKVLVESGAILEYLLDTYGKGRLVPPRDTPEFLRYRFWMHYAEGSAMPPLLLKFIFETVKRKTPWPVKPIAKVIANTVLSQFVDPQIKTHYGFIESELAKSTWFAGNELTAADMQMLFPIEGILARGARPDEYPRMREWQKRVHERPAYKKAEERGGPLEMLG